MKAIVTGGTGFIGSHLVKRLVDEGREVIVVSDFARLSMENLLELDVQPSQIEVRKADLTDYSQVLGAMEKANVVFHLAARVGNLEYLHATETAELAALQRNLTIDTNVFKVCQERGIGRIVYASSVAVYPVEKQYSHGVVLSEDDLTSVNPDGGYGWAKLMGEIQLGWMKNIDIGVARIFNIYGVNEPTEPGRAHAIADLIRKVLTSADGILVVQGDGTQTRDFLYVSDCVAALLQLEQKASSPPTIVNIGSGRAVSIGTIAKRIVELSGRDISIEYDPVRPVGPISRTADIAQAEALLGWQPEISFDEGLRLTYSWMRAKLHPKKGNRSR